MSSTPSPQTPTPKTAPLPAVPAPPALARTPAAISPAVLGPDGESAVAGAAVANLGRLLLWEHSTTAVLQEVAEAARKTIPGVVEASVTLLEGRRVSSVAWTGLLAYELDEVQYHSGDGPCMQAARTGTAQWVQNSRQDKRWPSYLRAAVQRGALSSYSVPVLIPSIRGVRVGLNLYSSEADGISAAAREGAVVFARVASTAVANRHAYDLAVRDAETLRRALDSRAVIEQAKGVLMGALGVSSDEAFAALAHRSQTTNVKVQNVGADLLARVQAGEGPSAIHLFRAGITPAVEPDQGQR